jgi:hypothetical protein
LLALGRGNEGATEISIVGNSFRSGNVGIAAIFLGVVLLIANYRRLLTSVERLK